MKIKALFLMGLIFAVPVFSAVGEVRYVADEVRQLLAEMPDARTDPEAYRQWKLEYARALRGDEPDTGFARAALAPMLLSSHNPYVDVKMSQTYGAFEEGARPSGSGSWLELTYYYEEITDAHPWSFSTFLNSLLIFLSALSFGLLCPVRHLSTVW